MARAPWSRGVPRAHLHQARKGCSILILLLVVVVAQTNSQAWNDGRNRHIMGMKESMNKMNDRFSAIENRLNGIQNEVQLIKKCNILHESEEKHFENINCPEYFVPINTTGECILIAKTYTTYKEASDNCASIGAHLVVPKDVRFLEAFLLDRESSLSHDIFWLGADDNLPPHIWRWVDGRPVDALTLLYSTAYGDMTDLYQRGSYCGVLRLGKMSNAKLSAELCDSEVQKQHPYSRVQIRLPYLCEIEPERETTEIMFPFEEICPKEYSQLPTGECIYISTVEDSLDYHGALRFCKAQGATLMFPYNITILEASLIDHHFDDEYKIWMDNTVRYLDQDWDDLMRQSRNESDTDMCTMLMTKPISNEIQRGVASCSLSQRFICKLKINPKLYNDGPEI